MTLIIYRSRLGSPEAAAEHRHFLEEHASRPSLVPRRHENKKSGLVSTVHACARIYGRGSVNVSVNSLSHMPRRGTATVYGIVSERAKNTLSITEMAVKLSKTAYDYLSATIMVAILP